MPAGVNENTSLNRSLSWFPRDGSDLFLAGINENGIPHYSIIYLRSSDRVYTSKAPGHIDACQAVCFARSGLLAAIAPNRIFWLRATFPTLHEQGRRRRRDFQGMPSRVSPARELMKYLYRFPGRRTREGRNPRLAECSPVLDRAARHR